MVTVPTAADFLQILDNFLPTGQAWPRQSNSVQTALLMAFSDAQALVAGREANLLIDAFPATTVELLPEWEASLGLPDPCLGPNPTLAQRQQAVVARLVANGGQSIPYFEQFSANLGYPDTTFTEFAPWRCGDRCGLPLYGVPWVYALQVNSPSLQIHYFRTGINVAGDPLAWWDNNALICELKRVAPAHVYLIFAFAP
jgi:uncharacterized protein YmfQ (DUF2313 family)